MAKYVRNATTTNVYGRKFYKGGDPVVGALVVLYNVTSSARVAKTTTDKYGRWNFELVSTLVPAGSTFEVRYYGTGLVQKSAPAGDWETFETGVNPLTQSVAIFYRGEYSTAKEYYYNSQRRDAVKHSGTYWLTVAMTSGVWDSSAWTPFGGSFDSVATDILLAQDATIARQLILGSEDTYFGVLRSPLASGLFQGNGFLLANEVTGAGLFRVGQVNGSDLVKGISWDGPNNLFQVKSNNFQVTPSGYMWADAGGFGGTADTPKVLIGTQGLLVKDGTLERVLISDENALWDNQVSRKTTNLFTEVLHDIDVTSANPVTDYWVVSGLNPPNTSTLTRYLDSPVASGYC